MATLNSIAEDIAFALGQQFNDTLRESIKNSIVSYRALFIRQDLQQNPLSYTDYLQSFCVQLEMVDRAECPMALTNCKVLRSKELLPKPLRLSNNGRVNFKFVGSIDRRIAYTFETAHGMQYMEHLPFQDSVIYYTVINQRLYVLNNLKICKVLIEEVIGDPRTLDDCEFPDTFADDLELVIPEDMLVKIRELIKREYRGEIKNGEEVTINKQ